MKTKKAHAQKRLDYVRNCFFPKSKKTYRKKERHSYFAIGMKYDVASLSSWSISIWISKTGIAWVRGPPFEGKHLEHARTSRSAPISPKGKPLGSHMVGWKYPVHPDTHTMIVWTISVKVDRKSSARKITQSRTFSNLRWLNLETPMNYGLRTWVWATLLHSLYSGEDEGEGHMINYKEREPLLFQWLGYPYIWNPNTMKKNCLVVIWIWKSSCSHRVFHMLREVSHIQKCFFCMLMYLPIHVGIDVVKKCEIKALQTIEEDKTQNLAEESF